MLAKRASTSTWGKVVFILCVAPVAVYGIYMGNGCCVFMDDRFYVCLGRLLVDSSVYMGNGWFSRVVMPSCEMESG